MAERHRKLFFGGSNTLENVMNVPTNLLIAGLGELAIGAHKANKYRKKVLNDRKLKKARVGTTSNRIPRTPRGSKLKMALSKKY